MDDAAVGRGPEVFEVPLWRALVVFRAATLAYAAVLVATRFRAFEHPAAAWAVVGVMAGWTAVAGWAYARRRRPGWPLLLADLVVAVGCVAVSPHVLGPSGLAAGTASIPLAWMAGPVLAWAIAGGRRLGVAAGVVVGAVHVTAWGGFAADSLDGAVLLLTGGVVVGHVARLDVEARQRLLDAVRIETAARERERFARTIHDSVLQVLTLVQRRGAELGGVSAELGRLAGEQEAALRELVTTSPVLAGPGDGRRGGQGRTGPGDRVDLRALLGTAASPLVSLAGPADPVWLPAGAAGELAEAVGAALANVRRHCGADARAWVLVEDDGAAVTVSIRDEGPGMPAGRLEQAAAEGRLGVVQSIRGRVRDLGGTVSIASVPGQGTEVEIRVPRLG